MKRIIAIALLVGAAGVALGASCTIRNESLSKIGTHDTFAAELRNDSGVDILAHKFQVSFFNDNLALVETRTVDGCLRSMQDGTSNFFSVASTLPSTETSVALARMANIIEDPAFKVGGVEQGNIEVSGVTAVRTGTSLAVAGNVKNVDGDDLEDAAVCIVVYNEDNRVITTARDTSPGDLDIDETQPFSATIAVPEAGDAVDHVDIWVDGLEDGTPTGPESSKGHDIAGATPTVTGTAVPATATSTPAATATP